MVLSAQKNPLIEVVLLSTHNMLWLLLGKLLNISLPVLGVSIPPSVTDNWHPGISSWERMIDIKVSDQIWVQKHNPTY